jgi:hypothetical protein
MCNRKVGDTGALTAVLVSEARPSLNNYSSLLEVTPGSGSGLYRFGKKEGPNNVNAGDVSAIFGAADLSKTIFTACTELAGDDTSVCVHVCVCVCVVCVCVCVCVLCLCVVLVCVCGCVCVYIYIYMHTYIHTHTHTHTHIRYSYAHTHTNIHAYIHTYVHTYMCAYTQAGECRSRSTTRT